MLEETDIKVTLGIELSGHISCLRRLFLVTCVCSLESLLTVLWTTLVHLVNSTIESGKSVKYS